MVFKKFEGQETVQIPVTTINAKVGDLISVEEGVATVHSTIADAPAGKKLYIIAQSDAVTEKTGTAYKSYAISDTVVAKEGIVVCYPVKDIEGLEA